MSTTTEPRAHTYSGQGDRGIEEQARCADNTGIAGSFCQSSVSGAKIRGLLDSVFNLKQLNTYVKTQHFKMESLKSLLDLLTPGCFMVKLDLQDAYNSIPVDKSDRPFLCFLHPETQEVLCYTCLPFGLSDAPRVITKILAPVASFLRKLGILLIVYLDDWLLVAKTKAQVEEEVQLAAYLLEHLGFRLNCKKSILQGEMVFLGVSVNSRTMELSLPQAKVALP